MQKRTCCFALWPIFYQFLALFEKIPRMLNHLDRYLCPPDSQSIWIRSPVEALSGIVGPTAEEQFVLEPKFL